MSTVTLPDMAKPDGKDSGKKRVGISLRFDPDLLAEIDEFCDSQEFKIDRTEFIEVAARRLLDEKRREQSRRDRKNGH